jgi:hypothetical protein
LPLRRHVERALGSFNALVLAVLAIGGVLEWLALLSRRIAHVLPPLAWGLIYLNPYDFLALPAVLALYGFLGHGYYRLRAWLVLPSGAAWVLVAFDVASRTFILRAYDDRFHRPHLDPLGVEVAVSMVLLIAGALSIESCVARLRIARRRGTPV